MATESLPQIIHGVECHEAWRADSDCPHERLDAIHERADEGASAYTGAEETAHADVVFLLGRLEG